MYKMKEPITLEFIGSFIGGDGGARTHDLFDVNEAL